MQGSHPWLDGSKEDVSMVRGIGVDLGTNATPHPPFRPLGVAPIETIMVGGSWQTILKKLMGASWL